jgi:hypothetical protein
MMEALFLTLIMSHRQISGAAALRVHQKISITLGDKPTVLALLSLIRALRAVKTKIIL